MTTIQQKKRGQIENFEKKLDVMLAKHSEYELVGIFYFIDPSFTKNKNYYTAELTKMSTAYNVEIHVFYGESLFEYLGYIDIWEEILLHLESWKKQIPDFPEINFDLDAQHTFEEIKDLKPLVFRKLLENEQIFQEIVSTLFPQKATLKLLLKYYATKSETIYKTISNDLKNRLGVQ